jgi:hypothetical protein
VTTGEQRKAEGQAQAKKRAGSEWLADSLFWLGLWVRSRREAGETEINFDQFRSSHLPDEPPNVNAWGSLPKAAVRAGLITPTDRVAKAQRPTAQARTVRVWAINQRSSL